MPWAADGFERAQCPALLLTVMFRLGLRDPRPAGTASPARAPPGCPGPGTATPARMSSAPVDCPRWLAGVTASARRWRALALLGIVAATSDRSSGLAVAGSPFTIACRSLQVFVTHRLKLP